MFALFFLKESSPEILAKRAAKAKGESTSEPTADAAKASEVTVETKEETPKEQAKEAAKPKVHLTLTMVLCFIFEFCIRWDINIFNSRYGIYLQDTFNTPSKLFSYPSLLSLTHSAVLVAGAVWNVFEQMLLYPFFVSKVGVPIPWLCFVGMLINATGLLLMTAKNQTLSLSATLLFWIGYCFGSPSAASILTVIAEESAEG